MGLGYRIFKSEEFIFDESNHKLTLTDNTEVAISRRAAEVLLILLENSLEVVKREYFFETIWKDTFVEEGNLAVAIASLRKAFRKNGLDSELIQTIPRQGYRFLSEVEIVEAVYRKQSEVEEKKPTESVNASEETPANQNLSKTSRLWADLYKRKVLTSIVLVVVLLSSVLGFYYRTDSSVTENPQRVVRLVIPPFTNLTPSAKNQELLGLEIADRLILKMGRSKNVKVLPIWNTLSYENNDFSVTSSELQDIADYVLTGNYAVKDESTAVSFRIIRTKDWKIVIDKSFELGVAKPSSELQEKIINEIVDSTEISRSPLLGALSDLADDEVSDEAYSKYVEGLWQFNSDKFEEAKASFQSTLDLSPEFANAWLMLSRTYLLMGVSQYGKASNYELALQAVEKAILLEPENVYFKLDKISLYIYTHQYVLAMRQCEELVKNYKTDPDLFRYLAELYMYTGLLDKSIQETERYLLYLPHEKTIFTQFIYTGQYDRFEETMYFNSKASYTIFSLGYVKMYKGEKEQAIEWFDKSYEVNQTAFPAQIAKVFSYILQGQNEKAKELLKTIEENLAQQTIIDGENLYRVGQAYSMLGDKTKALRTLARSIDSGFTPYEFFERDQFMQAVKDTKEFSRLIELAKKKQETFVEISGISAD